MQFGLRICRLYVVQTIVVETSCQRLFQPCLRISVCLDIKLKTKAGTKKKDCSTEWFTTVAVNFQPIIIVLILFFRIICQNLRCYDMCQCVHLLVGWVHWKVKWQSLCLPHLRIKVCVCLITEQTISVIDVSCLSTEMS